MKKKIFFFLSRISDLRDLQFILEKLLSNEIKVVIFFEDKIKKTTFKKFKNHGVEKIISKFSKKYSDFEINYCVPKSFFICKLLRPIYSLLQYFKRGFLFNKLTRRYSKNLYYLRIIYRFKIFRSRKFFLLVSFLLNFFEKNFEDKSVLKILKNYQPDYVVITPLIFDIFLKQNEIIKACKKLKISSTFILRSWDNLSNKSTMNIFPNNIITWNNFQREELQSLHANSFSKTHEIGASLYEYLYQYNQQKQKTKINSVFKYKNMTKENLVVYLGSSPQIVEDDLNYFSDLVIKLKLQNFFEKYKLLYRPHPLIKNLNEKNYSNEIKQLINEDKLIIYPDGDNFKEQILDKQLLCDTIRNSRALLGVNTSVMIEANFFNKVTIIPPEMKKIADNGLFNDTYHSKYLTSKEIGGTSIQSKNIENLIELIDGLDDEENKLHYQVLCENFTKNFLKFDDAHPPSERFVNLIKSGSLNINK